MILVGVASTPPESLFGTRGGLGAKAAQQVLIPFCPRERRPAPARQPPSLLGVSEMFRTAAAVAPVEDVADPWSDLFSQRDPFSAGLADQLLGRGQFLR